MEIISWLKINVVVLICATAICISYFM